jgi:acetyl esterase/lipase
MLYKQDNINIDYDRYGLETPKQKATLISYIVDSTEKTYLNRKRPAVIICVGGAYERVEMEKAEPIALQFCASGFHAFILNYSVAPVRFPGALLELSKAVATIRGASEKYNIHEDKIVVCGFSAGGHLAASLGVYWKEAFIQRFLGYDYNENQPNGLILGYPIISNKEGIAHLRSMQNLLGKYPDQRELELFSLEDNVNDLVPPTFLWHTSDDPIVPVENSLLFASALKKHDIPFELHVYPSGDHDLGLANELTASFLGQINPACQNWIDMAIRFINNL